MNASDRHTPLPDDLGEPLRDLSADDRAGLAEVWRLASPSTKGFPDPARLDAIWRQLDAATLPAGADARRDRAPAPRGRASRWFAGATAALVVAAIAVTMWFRPLSATAPLGERLVVSLADGSRIELNSGATLRYPRRFGGIRAVELEGEAFFDVATDGRPFIVETFDADVTVLGTTFNVRAWPNDPTPGTTVTLATGRVRLASRGVEALAPVVLEPGQTATVGDGRIDVSAPDSTIAGLMLAWRRGDFIYRDRQLGSILTDIERRFATRLTLTPTHLLTTRYSVSIRKPDTAEVIIRDLCGALGLQYRETREGFELFEPGT
ncbi:MAG: FecR domain-containing protein [Rhodothermales bacterium]|nr:FecR domain-containing protein [Rhodothermales bacterium]